MATEGRQLTISDLRPEHWPEVASIYEEGIATGNATFETSVPSWQDWDSSHLEAHRLVALDEGRVVGWAAVSPVSDRCVYGGVVENSVYVAEEARARGSGASCSSIWSPRPRKPVSGRSRPGSSPRTPEAFACTSRSGSRSSDDARNSASSTASGATCSCSNAAARSSSDPGRSSMLWDSSRGVAVPADAVWRSVPLWSNCDPRTTLKEAP